MICVVNDPIKQTKTTNNKHATKVPTETETMPFPSDYDLKLIKYKHYKD